MRAQPEPGRVRPARRRARHASKVVVALAAAVVTMPSLTAQAAGAAAYTSPTVCPSETLTSAQLDTLLVAVRVATGKAAAKGITVRSFSSVNGVPALHQSAAYDATHHRSLEVSNLGYPGYSVTTITGRSASNRAYLSVPGNPTEKAALALMHRKPGWKVTTSLWDTRRGLADAASFLSNHSVPPVLGWEFEDGLPVTCRATDLESVVHVVDEQPPVDGQERVRTFDLHLSPTGVFRSMWVTWLTGGISYPQWVTLTCAPVTVQLPPSRQIISRVKLDAAVDSTAVRSELTLMTRDVVDQARALAAAAHRAPRAADVQKAARKVFTDTRYTVVGRSDGVIVTRKDPMGGKLLRSRVYVSRGKVFTSTNV